MGKVTALYRAIQWSQITFYILLHRNKIRNLPKRKNEILMNKSVFIVYYFYIVRIYKVSVKILFKRSTKSVGFCNLAPSSKTA